MYQIVHGTAGLIIGSQTGNPWLAFIFGIISHFILDAIPHEAVEIKRWQDKNNFVKKIALQAIIDFTLLIILLLILYVNNQLVFNGLIAAGLAGSILPDYIWGFGLFFRIEAKWMECYKKFGDAVHNFIFKITYLPLKYAIIIQLIFFLGLLYCYLYLK